MKEGDPHENTLSCVGHPAAGIGGGIGQASDSVKTIGKKVISGEMTQITPVKVVIEHGGVSDEIPSIEIQSVNFGGEPGA